MRVLIIKHVENEDAGNFIEYLENRGISYTKVALHNGDPLPQKLDDISAILMLGGYMNVYEEDKFPFLKDETPFIQKAIENNIPFLGICLGGQLLAKACGAKVHKAEHSEIGVFDIDLVEPENKNAGAIFHSLPKKFPTFQWHGDTFDIPDGGTLLATSTLCRNQAFSIGQSAFGLQFHPEITEEMACDWVGAEGRDESIIADLLGVKDEYAAIARQIFDNFFEIAGRAKRI